MIEAIVLILSMQGHSIETYVFEDYIIKKHTCAPWLDSIMDKRFDIYDLKTGDIYIVPKDENVKILQPKKEPVFGVWSVMGKVVTIIDTVKSIYQGYSCVVETSTTKTETPLGSTDGEQIKYYADLSEILPFTHRAILHFLGVREFKYEPHLFQVEHENKYEDGTFTIFSMDIKREQVDKALFDEVLAYPVSSKMK